MKKNTALIMTAAMVLSLLSPGALPLRAEEIFIEQELTADDAEAFADITAEEAADDLIVEESPDDPAGDTCIPAEDPDISNPDDASAESESESEIFSGGGTGAPELASDISITDIQAAENYPAPADDNEIVYDASQFDTFKNRTMQDVVAQYSAARMAGNTYLYSDSTSWYSRPASVKAPYDPGILTEDTHAVMSAMTDFYRWLVGVQPLKAVSHHSDDLQAGALVRNYDFNHYISSARKPGDMSDALWEQGAQCDHNIIAMGYNPHGAIIAWINEGYSLRTHTFDTIGHRTALIGSHISDVQFGYAGSVAIGLDAGYDNTATLPFTAFPAPGCMPNDLVVPDESAWSVELNPSVLGVLNSDAVTVTVTNLSSGNSYTCTAADGSLIVGNTLVFAQPADAADGSYTGSYQVEITGLANVSGESARIRYTVEFTDVIDYLTSYVISAAADIDSYTIYQSMSDADSLNKIAAILPKEVSVAAESGSKHMLPVKGAWMVDQQNSCFVNSVDPAELPSNVTDRNNVLSRVTIGYTITDNYYDAYNSLYITPKNAAEGEDVALYIHRTNVSTNGSRIFRITPNGDGTYSCAKTYDSASSPEFDAQASDEADAYHIYHLSARMEDAGEYLSVYFNTEWGDYYVSTSTQTLQVSHSWDSGTITESPTCLHEGTKTFTCSFCGLTRTEPVAKLEATIEVNTSSINLKPGQTTSLDVTYTSGDSIKSWTSSNRKIVTVTPSGLITAKKKTGKATVTVTLESGLEKQITVTVTKDAVKTTKISGIPKKISLRRGKKKTLQPVISPVTSVEKVTYKTSNKRVAAVSKKGVITAKKKGVATITVTSGSKKATCRVTVK